MGIWARGWVAAVPDGTAPGSVGVLARQLAGLVRRAFGGRPGEPVYRGADRRGIIAGQARVAAPWKFAFVGAATVLVPFLVVDLLATLGSPSLPVRVWTTGASATAFLAFVFSAVLLAVRWRLVGEAAAGALAAAALVVGLVVVPSFASVPSPAHSFTAALRFLGVASALCVTIFAVRSPEVRSDLRPAVVAAAGLLVPLGLATAIGLSPVRTILASHLLGVDVVGAVAALACGAGAMFALRETFRRRRLLHGASVAVLLAVGAASGTVASGVTDTGRAWSVLPAVVLVVGGAVLLMCVVSTVNTSFQAVVHADLRGRRRWEAAESQLALLRQMQQGQEHDISATLGAVDGALVILQHQRDQLSPERIDQLTSAAREQINWLRTLLVSGDGSTSRYNVSELLGAVASLRSAGPQAVTCEVPPDLHIVGRPDRLALVVNNLLANAAAYAPNAKVSVRARPDDVSGSSGVEVVVADDGPGMGDIDRRRAFERGWRGRQSEGTMGSGLGLFQCREMIEAEGGGIKLAPTDPTAPPGRQGLSVQLWLPASQGAGSDSARSMA